MQCVDNPSEIIEFLQREENRNAFGEGREIVRSFPSGHGCCAQLREFFGNDGVALHYEIQVYRRNIFVGIHSEGSTPQSVHMFIRNQFKYTLKERQSETGTYRFAIQKVDWKGRNFDDILADIKKAVDALYRKYDAYLNYVEGYYAGKGDVDGCKSYVDFTRVISPKQEKTKRC